MGYIPLFLTMGGACLLFFLTVKNSLLKKLNLQKELGLQLSLAVPELTLGPGDHTNPDLLIEKLKNLTLSLDKKEEALKLLRQMKVNRKQYNDLIKKAPYNWVAKLGGFKEIA